MIRVGVLGAAGRMGSEVCRAVAAEDDMKLAAAVDPASTGKRLDFISEESELVISGDLAALDESAVEVAVDFTTPDSVAANIKWCLEHSIHAVVGTTGLSASDVSEIEDLCKRSSAHVLIAPNFALGAVLMMQFAETAAGWLPSAEIIELHHEGKLDAPSGTSLETVKAIARGRAQAGGLEREAKGPAGKESLPGARGAEKEGVRVHSVRLPGLVAHQEVVFGGRGETLSIRHDSLDRSSFMPGVLTAIRRIGDHPGLSVGLEKLLQSGPSGSGAPR